MIILGIDPGATRLGFGIINTAGGRTKMVRYGCFSFDDTSEESRPHAVFTAVKELLSKEKPDLVALEKVFFSKNKKTALAVSEARGAIMVAVADAGIPFRSFTPSQVKRAVSTSGTTSKEGIQKMMRLLLNLKENPHPDDAADALAVALCCAYTL